jgi:regulator of protease activity HflC (stomatin/prohibitin superfamily)
MKLSDTQAGILIIGALGAVALGVIFGLLMLGAQYRLWSAAMSGQAELRRAEWNRQIQVREASAKKDAATLLAEAEVERAKGVAQANKIIGDSLKDNEGYLRYLWIDSLAHTQDKVIYVPTEAGLPVLEAGRTAR